MYYYISFVIVQHVLILRCMYVCQSRLGPGAYQVTSYASAARVAWLHGLRACRMVTSRARVAWLHGLRACCMVTSRARGYMVCL